MFDELFIQETLTPILAIVGAVFGLVGTALGVLNYRLNRRQQKISLRIELEHVLTQSNGKFESLCLRIKVINSSLMPVTVSEIGLRIKKGFLRYENLPLQLSQSARQLSRCEKVYTSRGLVQE